jgi:RNA polymerase-binding transcription factor DksA
MDNLQIFADKLEVLRTEVVASLNEIAVQNHETGDWEVTTGTMSPESDTDLLADAAEAANERVSTLAELENRYQAIMRAQAKIPAGTYGICEVSGEPIETERLLVNPAARTCMHHMEEEYRIPL